MLGSTQAAGRQAAERTSGKAVEATIEARSALAVRVRVRVRVMVMVRLKINVR